MQPDRSWLTSIVPLINLLIHKFTILLLIDLTTDITDKHLRLQVNNFDNDVSIIIIIQDNGCVVYIIIRTYHIAWSLQNYFV